MAAGHGPELVSSAPSGHNRRISWQRPAPRPTDPSRSRRPALDIIELGAIGEFVGAIAVVISLIYLSRQVKENTRALRTANAATVQANFGLLASQHTEDRETAEIILRGLEDDSSLTRAERIAAYGWFFNCLKAGELAHHQFKAGQLDEEVWEASLTHFRAYWETPGMRRYWEERRLSFIPEFREEVDRWISDAAGGPLRRTDLLFVSEGGDGQPSP